MLLQALLYGMIMYRRPGKSTLTAFAYMMIICINLKSLTFWSVFLHVQVVPTTIPRNIPETDLHTNSICKHATPSFCRLSSVNVPEVGRGEKIITARF